MPRRRPGPAALGAALGLAVAAGLARAQSASPAASSPPLPPAASLAPSAASAASPASPASPSEGARAPAMEPDDYDDYAFPSPAGRAVLRTELAYAAGAPQYTGPIPQCGYVVVSAAKCKATLVNPFVYVFDAGEVSAIRSVPFSGNGLRKVVQATFPASQAKPTSYANPPGVTFVIAKPNSAPTKTARLIPSRQNSITINDRPKYLINVQQGGADDDLTALPNNLPCKAYVFASCSRGCPIGEANFGNGAGCVEAIKLSEACASGSCITGFNGTFLDSGDTCVASCPGGDPTSGDVC